MLQRVQQNKWLRLGMGVLGGILLAVSINLFVVPQGMYSGGLYGLCQVIRTLVVERLGLATPFDLAGILYLLFRKNKYDEEHLTISAVHAASHK